MKIDSTALLESLKQIETPAFSFLPMKTILVGTGYIVVLIAFVIGIRLLLRSEIGLAILDILLGLFVVFAIGMIVRVKRKTGFGVFGGSKVDDSQSESSQDFKFGYQVKVA